MSKFFINILLLLTVFFASAQEQQQDSTAVASDTVVTAHKFPVSFNVGFDVGKFVLARINNSESIDFTMDASYKKYSAVVEVGFETRNIDNTLLKYQVKGTYFRIGADYNLYDNWEGMNNVLSIGVRYGHASYDANLSQFVVNQPNNIWQPEVHNVDKSFDNLSASWLEFVGKMQVETFKNVYLGYSISLKYALNVNNPNDFEVGYIPGFFKTNSFSKLGFGMQYIISYKFDF